MSFKIPNQNSKNKIKGKYGGQKGGVTVKSQRSMHNKDASTVTTLNGASTLNQTFATSALPHSSSLVQQSRTGPSKDAAANLEPVAQKVAEFEYPPDYAAPDGKKTGNDVSMGYMAYKKDQRRLAFNRDKSRKAQHSADSDYSSSVSRRASSSSSEKSARHRPSKSRDYPKHRRSEKYGDDEPEKKDEDE